ncbi:T-cell surface antigen CD2 [Mus caroli]|uniref:T-cell surface antigen CD2 n=1 Tax=Mus caroli TaxID=10089 RepID=A0A6P5PB53_MUSCR|nr:T-cell surface antigen CD2 [Mus caroli]
MKCKFLGSFFLLFSLSGKGVDCRDNEVIWGVLGHGITLNIPNFQMTDDIDEVRWERRGTLVAEFKRKGIPYSRPETYEVLANGSLKIKKPMMRNDSDTYEVMVYGTNGMSTLKKKLDVRILERVSKPVIHWECSNTTVTCEVLQGTDFELKLYQGEKQLNSLPQKNMSYQWTDLRAPFKCEAINRVSKESKTEVVNCSEKGLYLYVTVGAGAGLLLVFSVALLIFCICKRKKRSRRRKDEELEIKTSRTSTVERGPKPHSTPAAAAAQNPVVLQAPPPPGHHLQTPGHRPLPPSHRTREHQQKKRPPPSGTQIHQQKGPPLPRPRVQPKPPCGSGEGVSLPPPN